MTAGLVLWKGIHRKKEGYIDLIVHPQCLKSTPYSHSGHGRKGRHLETERQSLAQMGAQGRVCSSHEGLKTLKNEKWFLFINKVRTSCV